MVCIFYDQIIRGKKMLEEFHSPGISKEIDAAFLSKTIQTLEDLCNDVQRIID